jgi:hypothetical protein
MSKRAIGLTLIALGAVGMVVSLAVDALGIGNRAGIGWKQLLGTAAGMLVVLYGSWSALHEWSRPK